MMKKGEKVVVLGSKISCDLMLLIKKKILFGLDMDVKFCLNFSDAKNSVWRRFFSLGPSVFFPSISLSVLSHGLQAL